MQLSLLSGGPIPLKDQNYATTIIYFIEDKKHKATKIGSTKNLKKRLATLKGTYGKHLRIIHSFQGTPHTERMIHYHLQKFRLKYTKEWFESDAVQILLDKGISAPDTVPAKMWPYEVDRRSYPPHKKKRKHIGKPEQYYDDLRPSRRIECSTSPRG